MLLKIANRISMYVIIKYENYNDKGISANQNPGKLRNVYLALENISRAGRIFWEWKAYGYREMQMRMDVTDPI